MKASDLLKEMADNMLIPGHITPRAQDRMIGRDMRGGGSGGSFDPAERRWYENTQRLYDRLSVILKEAGL